MTPRAVSVVALSFVMMLAASSDAQERPGSNLYLLSEDLQEFAFTNQIYEKLSSREAMDLARFGTAGQKTAGVTPKPAQGKPGTAVSVALYVNVLTAIDVIARVRAGRQKDRIDTEHYHAAAWVLCLLPWSPPKAKEDVAKISTIRPLLVDDALVNPKRRDDIRRRINQDKLRLSARELESQRLTPLSILDITGLVEAK